jgi:hypothetical protein
VNYTLLTADKVTHLRVVCVALSAAILVVSVCSFARLSALVDARESADRGKIHFSAAGKQTPL